MPLSKFQICLARMRSCFYHLRKLKQNIYIGNKLRVTFSELLFSHSPHFQKQRSFPSCRRIFLLPNLAALFSGLLISFELQLQLQFSALSTQFPLLLQFMTTWRTLWIMHDNVAFRFSSFMHNNGVLESNLMAQHCLVRNANANLHWLR